MSYIIVELLICGNYMSLAAVRARVLLYEQYTICNTMLQLQYKFYFIFITYIAIVTLYYILYIARMIIP
jgi:hypothetical protein